nr:uncharacterized protein LOC110381625 [Helicoverpa armigera]
MQSYQIVLISNFTINTEHFQQQLIHTLYLQELTSAFRRDKLKENIKMKSFLVIALLAVTAAASVITHEAPEPAADVLPEGSETQELQVADADEVPMSEMAVFIRKVLLADEEMSFVAPRNGMSLGNIGASDRLLSASTHSRNPIANQVQTVNVRYTGSSSIIILAVRAYGSGQGASARVVEGYLGRNSITIQLQSARGRGFHYRIEIWGR